MGDLRNQRSKLLPLNDLASSQRQGTHRPTVERAIARDDVLPTGVVAGELERRFDTLRAGVRKVHPARPRPWRGTRQTLGHLDLGLVVEVGTRHVQVPIDLRPDRLDHMRVAMPG